MVASGWSRTCPRHGSRRRRRAPRTSGSWRAAPPSRRRSAVRARSPTGRARRGCARCSRTGPATRWARPARNCSVPRAAGDRCSRPTDAGPGSTSLAPFMAPAQGTPQALTWNSGTTGSTLSRGDMAKPSAAQAVKECSTVERWLQSTPLRVAGGARGVAERRGGVLVEHPAIRDPATRRPAVARSTPGWAASRPASARRPQSATKPLTRSSWWRQLGQGRCEADVDEDIAVLGMVDDVGRSARKKPRVDVCRMACMPGRRSTAPGGGACSRPAWRARSPRPRPCTPGHWPGASRAVHLAPGAAAGAAVRHVADDLAVAVEGRGAGRWSPTAAGGCCCIRPFTEVSLVRPVQW